MTVICNVCSLVYTNPIPSQEAYYSFYRNDYEKYYGRSTASKPSTLAEPVVFSVLKRFIDISLADYLEIGPGRGQTLFHANRLFKTAKGVEPSLEFVKILQQDLQLDVTVGTAEEFMVDFKGQVDVIAMFHVLEHIYNPYEGLLKIREVIRESGIIVIEVPNIMKPFRDLDSYFLRFVHPFNFSPFTLKVLLTRAGFEVVYADDGVDHWSVPQNITIIARKINNADTFREVSNPAEAKRVVQTLNEYRTRYATQLRYKWFVADMLRTPIKYLRKIKYKIGRLFK